MLNHSEKGKLFLHAGEETEDLVCFITNSLDDTTLDEIEVERIQHKAAIASEPMTVGVILLGGAAIYSVARILEKWIEKKREEGFRKDLIAAWDHDPKLGETLAEMEKTHSRVVVHQGMPNFKDLDIESWAGGLGSGPSF